jgi:type I restriction enzyme S subunit
MVEVENRIQHYETYKDSGVEWLGEIPEHWECIRMKHLYKDVSIKNRPNELLSSVTQDRGVIPRDWIESRMVMPSGNLDSFKFIEKEDFAISLRSFEGGLEYCYHDGIISPAYTVLKKKKENLFPIFYKYLFKSISFISELQTSVVGIREGKNISYFELSYSSLPIPPLKEQTAIAQFLDDKTTKIDEAIAIKEKQINLLKERKQILIHKAVTRGLDDTVKLKDSGVEWIGEIPEHWEVKKMTYVCKIDTGATPDRSNGSYWEGNIPWIKTGEVNYEVINTSEEFITEKGLKNSATRLAPVGTLLMAMYGQGVTRGRVSLLGIQATYNQACCAMLFNKEVYNKYAYYFFVMAYSYIRDGGNETSQMNISAGYISGLKIVQPPLSEQKEISAYIETSSQKIETAICLKQQEIEKLKEYKSSLINSVVMGKVRVC